MYYNYIIFYEVNKVDKEKTKQTKKLVRTKVRADKSIEVEFQKHPKDTIIGKILLYLIIIGTVILPVALLIYVIIEAFS